MKLMVIDGNSIVNRAFFGIRMLTTHDGTPTNAVYGFLTILLKLLSDEQPDGLCVTFDLKAPTFRHLQYEGYKAQRKGMPEELSAQMPILKAVLDAMNIPRYELEGWEADDLIGTIARRCSESGWQCVAVTGDKDSFQLIGPNTFVRHVKTRMGQTETVLYDTARFEEEYGFLPPVMVDLKALMGDSSDNIPGVAGVGEKTALDLLHRFGTVKNLYENLDSPDIRESVRKKLTAGEEACRMSFDLATIRCEAPMDFKPEDNLRREPDNDALYEWFRKLEFAKLMDRFGLKAPAAAPAEAEAVPTYAEKPLASLKDWEDLQAELAGGPLALSLTEDGTLALVYGSCCRQLKPAAPDYDQLLKAIMESPLPKQSFEVKELHRRLLAKGISARGWAFDCALAAYLLNATDNAYGLDRLCLQYLGRPLSAGREGEEQLSLLDAPAEANAALEQAQAIAQLAPILEQQLKDNGMESLLKDMELPLCQVLAKMEEAGFLVDRQALKDFGAMLAAEAAKLEAQIYELAGERFNINSPKQLGVILFEKLMLPAPKKTKTGYSTSADVLDKLTDKHPIIKLVLEYRQLSKLKSTYADGLTAVIGEDGRIHTSFQMMVTATGRLSSTEPNLQNIPARTPLGAEIRKMFIAGPGMVLVDADYSQIELRLLAHISGDEVMRRAFLNGEDIHAVTASQVLGIPLAEVTKQQRSNAKAVNFGIVYGISAFSLSQDINVTVAEAKAYMESYLARYSGVREYMKAIVEKAKLDGQVTSLYGRRRALPELKSSNFNLRAFGERVALNMPIQATAADIMKLAMVRVDKALQESGLKARLLLQVHDELIAECPEEEAEQVAALISREMQGAAELSVPLPAEAHWGKSWHEAK